MFLCQDLVLRYCLFDLFIVVLFLVCIIVPHLSFLFEGCYFSSTMQSYFSLHLSYTALEIEFTRSQIIAAIPGTFFCAWYASQKHWLANNILGLAFCIQVWQLFLFRTIVTLSVSIFCHEFTHISFGILILTILWSKFIPHGNPFHHPTEFWGIRLLSRNGVFCLMPFLFHHPSFLFIFISSRVIIFYDSNIPSKGIDFPKPPTSFVFLVGEIGKGPRLRYSYMPLTL